MYTIPEKTEYIFAWMYDNIPLVHIESCRKGKDYLAINLYHRTLGNLSARLVLKEKHWELCCMFSGYRCSNQPDNVLIKTGGYCNGMYVNAGNIASEIYSMISKLVS